MSLVRVGQADVYRDEELAGRILREARGSTFEYDEAFLQRHGEHASIAFRLPATRRRHLCAGLNLHPFFAGLLPEGLRLVTLTQRVKTSPDDMLSLLMAAGADCVGNVSVAPAGQSLRTATPTADTRHLENELFADLFERSLRFPGLENGGESSIPGVQHKLSASMISFPVKPREGAAAYILKLNPPDHARLVENEHYFMNAAKTCGIEAAYTQLVHDQDGSSGLLVERFDRLGRKGLPVLKIHQEDACQLLDRYPADKYHVSFAQVSEAVREVSSAPIVDMARLLRIKAFAYLIANGDMHAKNISVRMLPGSRRVELTPVYDMLSTLPYGDQSMALAMEGRDRRLKRAHFVAFGERFGVRPRATTAMLDEVCAALTPAIDGLEAIGLDERRTSHLRRTMRERREELSA